MKKNALYIVLILSVVLCMSLVNTGPVAAVSDFTGLYEMQNWNSNGISGGTTSISPLFGPAVSAEFGYDVFLGSPGGGVSYRTTTFSTTATSTGNVSFDWSYYFYHAWFMVDADFYVFADGPSGMTSIHEVDFYNQSTTGPRTISGSSAIWVEEGYDFGFILGGSNFDSNSKLSGTLTVSNFIAPPVIVEINIKPGSIPNSINPKANGVIPVAILTTNDFDASTVNPQTVALEGISAQAKGRSGKYGALEDIDNDGDLDLVVHIPNEIYWGENVTEATLTGMTWDGAFIEGIDSINIVPDCK